MFVFLMFQVLLMNTNALLVVVQYVSIRWIPETESEFSDLLGAISVPFSWICPKFST